MNKFEIGDKVKVIRGWFAGRKSKIKDSKMAGAARLYHLEDFEGIFDEGDLELVESAPDNNVATTEFYKKRYVEADKAYKDLFKSYQDLERNLKRATDQATKYGMIVLELMELIYDCENKKIGGNENGSRAEN